VATYILLASESTVQVLSPTFVNDVVYCTIQTHPSLVIASMPIQADVFNAGGGGPELTAFANAIEDIMAMPEVVAATGTQVIDASGLIADQVAFTVQYVPPTSSAATSITAECLIRVAELNFEDSLIGATLLADVKKQIDAVYNQLKAAASG
jgi:hypothetical protein